VGTAGGIVAAGQEVAVTAEAASSVAGELADWAWCLVGPSLPELATAVAWATTPDSGAVVTFSGVVRDHAPGYDGVTAITYEAYETETLRRLAAVAQAARHTWPALNRIALWHRTGVVELGQASVQVVVSSAHRVAAFAGAQFCIDVLKACVPVWKLEHTAAGSGWATVGVDAESVPDAVDRWLQDFGSGAGAGRLPAPEPRR
jgi:molybdopterin synthase catalytic subunit